MIFFVVKEELFSVCNFFCWSFNSFEESADGEGDLLVFHVDFCDLSVDLLANLENFFWLADTLVSDLRNVDETVNAWHYFCECAEWHELYDFNVSNIACCILFNELCPWVIGCESVAEGDLLLFCVESDNEYVNLLADCENFGWVLDVVPGEFGNVNHAVYAADINECAVRCEGLNCTFVLVANSDFCPYLSFSFLASVNLESG